MELIISRQARARFQLADELFAAGGNRFTADLAAVRDLATRLNADRDLARNPEQAVRAGQLNALGLVFAFLRRLIVGYGEERRPGVMGAALAWLSDRFGREKIERALRRFVEQFPPTALFHGATSVEEWLSSGEAGSPSAEQLLEDMLLLWVINRNPAFAPARELFDDSELVADTPYDEMMASLAEFFAAEPGYGEADHDLFSLLQAPMKAAPDSPTEQLASLMRDAPAPSPRLVERSLVGLDVVREEEKPVFIGGGPPPPEPPDRAFEDLADEEARFSPDRDWMPSLVLIAKNALVWLHQLSATHDQSITTLDQIPDSELDRLAAWGFTGLWLIGLWERSQASARIKQLCGNPEAAASAYAIEDYVIAEELGGEAAYEDLRDRAWKRGLRLACDMVPNHMGIDSRWVREHPERFLGRPDCPFPGYTFNGPDLSSDPRIGIFLEDHYYDRTDAAVVFARLDRESGELRFLYHGNDGTSLPWNDTAQLDYLDADTREAVIEAILDVARRFPVIRFDAAMTLANRHIQRLWYPPPGKGGDIPSRAGHGISEEAFAYRLPEEFWRQVVDRVAAEAPDTLLLAEAFWLMEGYFVRTLGMHRVYNSAFMHMLRDEKNAELRASLAKTLAFEPDILKRYVNFLTNPDEAPAAEQFGDGEKYFGCCALLATLPGLPLFGHDQLAGGRERYGMEYRRAYRDEAPAAHVLARHRREIVPLLRRRALFAEVERFRLFNFELAPGRVSDHVFAFSNRDGTRRALVLYNNHPGEVSGWVRRSVPFRGADEAPHRQTLAQALDLEPKRNRFYILRDTASGLAFLRDSQHLCRHGLFVRLGPYGYRVLLGFETVMDDENRRYRRLADALHGRGVPSLEDALRALLVQPVQAPFRALLDPRTLRRLLPDPGHEGEATLACEEIAAQLPALLAEVRTALTALEEEEGDREETAEEEKAPEEEADLQEEALEEAGGEDEPADDEAGEEKAGEDGEGESLEDEDEGSLPEDEAATPVDDATAALGAHLVGHLRATIALLANAERKDATGIAAFIAPPKSVPSDPEPSEDEAADDAISYPARAYGLLAWSLLHGLGPLQGPDHSAAADHRAFLDTWRLGPLLGEALAELGISQAAADRTVAAVKLFTSQAAWLDRLGPGQPVGEFLAAFLGDEEVGRFLQLHRFDDVLWINRESFRDLCWWLPAVAAVRQSVLPAEDDSEPRARALAAATALQAAEEASGYRMDQLLATLGAAPTRSAETPPDPPAPP